MVQLHHFGRLEVRGGELGEIIGQHRGDREVRRDEHGLIGTRRRSQRLTHLLQTVLGPAGGTDHHVHALTDQRQHIVQRDGRHGELHDHISVLRRDGVQVIARIQRERQLHVRCAVDRVHHVGSHAPFGADDGNLDHCCLLDD